MPVKAKDGWRIQLAAPLDKLPIAQAGYVIRRQFQARIITQGAPGRDDMRRPIRALQKRFQLEAVGKR